jgi:hypothetical protein
LQPQCEKPPKNAMGDDGNNRVRVAEALEPHHRFGSALPIG